jgi:hypothetical protein
MDELGLVVVELWVLEDDGLAIDVVVTGDVAASICKRSFVNGYIQRFYARSTHLVLEEEEW